MILKPQLTDIKRFGYYLGKITIGVGLTIFLPFIMGLVFFKETKPALDFLLSAEIAFFRASAKQYKQKQGNTEIIIYRNTEICVLKKSKISVFPYFCVSVKKLKKKKIAGQGRS